MSQQTIPYNQSSVWEVKTKEVNNFDGIYFRKNKNFKLSIPPHHCKATCTIFLQDQKFLKHVTRTHNFIDNWSNTFMANHYYCYVNDNHSRNLSTSLCRFNTGKIGWPVYIKLIWWECSLAQSKQNERTCCQLKGNTLAFVLLACDTYEDILYVTNFWSIHSVYITMFRNETQANQVFQKSNVE